MKSIAICLLCAACFVLPGCTFIMPKTTARVVAWSYVKPVINALAAFHQKHGEFPKTLDGLRSEYPKALEGMKSENGGALYEKLAVGNYIDWTIQYRQESRESYLLIFNRGPCDAAYRNGKLISSSGNPVR